MDLTSTEIMEITFNILYLIFIWTLVILMLKNRDNVKEEDKPVAIKVLCGFFLLALGDTGHVGFRVIAYALGGLEENSTLVGLGALSTAITVGILYIFILEMWRLRYNYERNWIYYIMFGVGVLRLILFIFPENQWTSTTPPFGWSLVRNIPLMIQGLGVAILIIKDAQKKEDTVFKQFAYCIFISYAFYIPVILFVQKIPMIGMLMIPKTVAYMAMAWIGYKNFFKTK